MDKDILLQKKLRWLQRQKEIPALPVIGNGFELLRGTDILNLKRVQNDALVAITELGNFYLIATHWSIDGLTEAESRTPYFQRLSKNVTVNLRRITEIDYDTRTVYSGSDSLMVDDEYWEAFVEAYEAYLKTLN